MMTPLNFILLLIIAFVFFKLRSVLGMRNPEDYKHRPPKDSTQDSFEESTKDTQDAKATIDQEETQDDIAAQDREPVSTPPPTPFPESGRGIALLRQHQPDFDEAQFLAGAAKAYELILKAFADDTLDQVKDILSDDVYAGFATALAARKSEGKALITQIITQHRPHLEDALIIETTANGADALQVQLEVRFRAEILSYLVDEADKNQDKAQDKEQAIEETMTPKISDDLWIFEQTHKRGAPFGQKWRLISTGD